MAETWVVNASPVIVLAKIGRLDLLAAPERTLLLPDAVVREILAAPEDDAARRALMLGELPDRPTVAVPPEVLEWSLGAGESAVIALARERGATPVLDDFDARSCARSFGLTPIGSLGVVLRARREGRIPAAKPVILALRTAGLHLDDALIRTALKAAVDEAWNG